MQSVKDGSTSEWSAASQFALLTLANDADNKSIINKFHDMTAHVTLADRTIYKDGTWNTVYLPFDLTPDEFDASPLAGADVRTLRNALTVENESVTMNFTDAGAIESAWGVYYGGVPYIMKWDSGSDVVSPEFANVTITKYESPMKGSDTDTNSGISIVFKGTYAPINFTAEDTSILFIGANIDAVETGARFGLGRDRVANYRADSRGTGLLYESVGRAVSQVRCSAPLAEDWNQALEDDVAERGR